MDPPEGFHLQMVGEFKFIVPKRYSRLSSLGHGAQGHVVEALDHKTNQVVAIKKLSTPFQNETHAKRAYRELILMKACRHKNVISLLDAFTPQSDLASFNDMYLVLDKMDATLSNVVCIRLDHERLSYLLYQLFCGLKHLHKSKIIHRDLKPTNIAVKNDCSLKILDFGLARSLQDSYMNTPYVVTRYYRAPEVILGNGYEELIDVWAVGCIFAELVLERILFPGEDHIDQWNKITDILGTPDNDFISTLDEQVQRYLRTRPPSRGHSFEDLFPDDKFQPPSEQHSTLNANYARDLLSKMLQIDPRKRHTVDQCINHPYINVWYDRLEVDAPPARAYDYTIDEKLLNVQDWKNLIFNELKTFATASDPEFA